MDQTLKIWDRSPVPYISWDEVSMAENQLEEVGTVRELWVKGYRPVIRGLMAEGLDNKAIVMVLEEEFGLKVNPYALGKAVQFIGEVTVKNTDLSRREASQLHQISLSYLDHFMKRYAEAEAAGDFKEMRFFAERIENWHKSSKDYYQRTGPAVAVQNNFTQNTVSLDADIIKRVLESGNAEAAKIIIDAKRATLEEKQP